MRIDVLQALRELVIKTIHKTDDASPNADDSCLFLVRRYAFGQFIVVVGDFLYGVSGILGDNGDKLVDFALSREPQVYWHMCRDRRVVVKTGGDKSKQHANTLVRCYGNFQQFFKDFDLFSPISVL